MSELTAPHLEYLRTVHSDAISRAGLPQPNFEEDQSSGFTYGINDRMKSDSTHYYEHMRREGYLADVYDDYARVFDNRLCLEVPKRGQAIAIWTLGSIARGVGRMHGSGADSADVSSAEIQQLSIVNTDPRKLSPVVVRLKDLGVLGVNTYDSLGGAPERINRYYLIQPKQGHGKKERPSLTPKPRGQRILPGLALDTSTINSY